MKIERHPILGWPIVTAENCFDTVRELGIKKWPVLHEEPLEKWLTHATPEELESFRRFGPKSFFLELSDPRSGNTDSFFRTIFKPAAVIFALIDGKYVAATAEYKHGNDRITIVPPAGVPGKKEDQYQFLKMQATAFREWNEETGLTLSSATLLAPVNGVYSYVRPTEIQFFPFLGHVEHPIVKGPTKYDKNEHIVMLLFLLDEWITLIENFTSWDRNLDFGLEMCARDVTYSALRKLGRLQLT